MTSQESRDAYTFLSDIQASRTSDSTLSVSLKDRLVDVRFGINVEDGGIELNSEDMTSLCKADDVSLSSSECDKLYFYLEEVARG